MKEWLKKCPFCANEIKEWAIKCQYCESFLDWRDLNIKKVNKKNVTNIIIKILVTLIIISILILLINWMDQSLYRLDDWYPAYTKIYLYNYFLYFFSVLTLSIIYAWRRSKASLIVLWINLFLLILWYIMTLVSWDDCRYIWDVYYCQNWWRYAVWHMLFLMSIPILIISLVIYLLRLVWWKKSK